MHEVTRPLLPRAMARTHIPRRSKSGLACELMTGPGAEVRRLSRSSTRQFRSTMCFHLKRTSRYFPGDSCRTETGRLSPASVAPILRKQTTRFTGIAGTALGGPGGKTSMASGAVEEGSQDRRIRHRANEDRFEEACRKEDAQENDCKEGS
jgi:hypothetical protein